MHLVQRLLSLRENKGSGSEEAHSEGFPASGSGEGAAPLLRTWCKDSRKTLFFRFLCTKSLVFFGAPTLRTWCKDSRKTLFLRFPCTKFFESNPPAAMRRGALSPSIPYSLIPSSRGTTSLSPDGTGSTKIDVKSKLFRPPTSIRHMGTGVIRVPGGFFRIELTIML